MTHIGGYVMLGIYVRTSKDDTANSIEQQKEAGISFAVSNQMEFEVYEDEGKSGYRITDDEDDLFRNRPGFTKLLIDIRAKKIDAVWVWEQSRLSRNQYASARIFYDFEKSNIKIYVKDTLYDSKDKNAKLMRGILDAMAEYERELIVSRTTRGSHDRINRGERSFGQLYGYKKKGKDRDGKQILEAVEHEIENLKYGYKRILEGATLRQLTLELYKKKSVNKTTGLRLSQKWHKLLLHFSYTGYALNMEGLEIFKKFKKFEIDHLAVLLEKTENNKPKYYVRSTAYPEKIVSIENWIKAAERLQINSRMRQEYHVKKASKDLATGLITCSECGQKYYSYTHGNRKGSREYSYTYYKHFSKLLGNKCTQKKSFATGNINEMFKVFFFLNYIVYDNTPETHEETMRMIKQEQSGTKERIKDMENEIKQSERNIKKYERSLNNTDDIGTVNVLAKRISVEEEKQKELYLELSKRKMELENLNIKYAREDIENMYYNVKDTVKAFFETEKVQEQRDMLSRAIKNCIVMGDYIIIDAGHNLFVCDTSAKYNFNREKIKELEEDRNYKYYYMGIEAYWNSKEYDKKMAEILQEVEDTYEDIFIDPALLKDEREYIEEKFAEYHLDYDYSKFEQVIFIVKDESEPIFQEFS
jgi:DNA invertase Pin-like site-specific DNA recombinase